MTPVLSRAQIRAYDEYAIGQCGVPGVVLMENAGRGASEFIARLYEERALRQPVVIVCGIGIGFLYRAISKTDRGRAVLDRFWLSVPVLGRVIRFLAIARLTRTLGSLLASSVNIVQALNIARHVANNSVFEAAADTARESILEGAALATPLRSSGEFPPLVTTMVEVGERSGDLEGMLIKVADTYEEQVETSVTRLTSLMEPILILVMVGVVGIIIMAVLMPMLQLTESIG